MRDLSYTICSNYFFHQSLSKEQRLNGMRWDKPDSKGRIMSGSLTPESSYSITEFITKKDFSVTYQSGASKGYLLIINQLSNASFLQIKTQERFETDYSPREIEMIILPASKNLTVTYAPETLGKRLEIFIEESQAEALFTSSFLAVLKDEDALYFSNKMCDSCYEKLEEISRVLFKEAFAIADKFIAKRIVDMLSQFSGLAKKV
jgi:hypothetical protein